MASMADDPSSPGPVRLADLIHEGRLLWVYCNRCGHERDVEPATVPLPGDTAVPFVGKHMRCGRCGYREISTMPEHCPGGVVAARSRAQEKQQGGQ